MKKVKQIVFGVLTIVCSLYPQITEKHFHGSGAPASELTNPSLSPSDVNFVYNLELFPGQSFIGNYYYWTNSNSISANFQISPSVSWLSISPESFTSTSCSDIVPISYNFVAPQTPGTYIATIQDLNGNWPNTVVTLTVTETPSTFVVRSYHVNQGQTISQFDTLYWNGFGSFGCQNNYIPGNTRLFNFTERNPVPWFEINPPNITVPIFGSGVIESTITGNITGSDYVYIIEEAQYSSFCYFFRVELSVITDVENSNTSDIPKEYALEQNYPNPFNPTTNIQFLLPESGDVTLKVFNLLGEEVKTLVNQEMPAGNHSIQFNASSFASGIYFYRLQAGDFVETKKMILIR